MAKGQTVNVNIKGKETVSVAANKAEGGLGKLERTVGRFKTSVLPKLGLVTAAVTGIGVAAARAAVEGARIETMEQTFANLAASTGESADEILGKLREMTRGTISNANLIASANRAISFDIPMERLEELAQVARAAARTMGESTSKMLDDLVTGLARGSREIIDNLGLTVSFGEANEKLASQLGVATTQLTAAEQMQARLNETMEAGAVLADRLGDSLEEMTNLDKMQQLEASTENIGNSIRELMAELLAGPAGGLAGFLQGAVTGLEARRSQNEDVAFMRDVYQSVAVVTDDIARTQRLINETLERENELRTRSKALTNQISEDSWKMSQGTIQALEREAALFQQRSLNARDMRFALETHLYLQNQLVEARERQAQAAQEAQAAANAEAQETRAAEETAAQEAQAKLANYLQVAPRVIAMARSLLSVEEQRKLVLQDQLKFLEEGTTLDPGDWPEESAAAFQAAWDAAIAHVVTELRKIETAEALSLDQQLRAGPQDFGSKILGSGIGSPVDIGLGSSLLGMHMGGAQMPNQATADAQAFDGFIESMFGAEEGLANFAMGLDPLTSALIQGAMGIENVRRLLDPLGTALDAMFKVIEPAVNSVLAPLVGILVQWGNFLGGVLVPLFKALEPVITLVAEVFVWIYNNALLPIGNLLIAIFTIVGIAFASFVNAIFALIRIVTLNLVNLQDVVVPSFDDREQMQEINLEDLKTAGAADSDFDGTTGSTTTVTPVPNIYFTQNIMGPNFIGTDTEELGEVTEQALHDFQAAGGSLRFLQA